MKRRGRPRGSTSTLERDLEVIRAVLSAWNKSYVVVPKGRNPWDRGVRRTLRGGEGQTDGRGDPLNVFEFAGRKLHRSASAVRKAFEAAWARQCPNESSPNWERRRAVMRMALRMSGCKLPRSWDEEPFVSQGDK
jgi:hypothetical protein